MNAGRLAPPAGLRRLAAVLFFFCVLFYNLNHHYQGTADTAPNVYLPISIILHGDVYLDRFPTLAGTADTPPPYYLQVSRGRLVSSFPILPALLAVPVYLGPALWLRANGTSYDSETFHDTCVTAAKLSASMMAAGSVVLVLLTLAGCTSTDKAFALACLYAFGTAVFAVASQALWGHGPAIFFLSAAGYLWLHHPARLVALGASLALAVTARPAVAVTAAVFACFVAIEQPKKLVRFLFVPALVAGVLVAYNWHLYGAVQGGYAEVNADVISRQELGGLWTSAVGTGLAGLLISPSRGLLIYSPFLAPAFLALFRTFRQGTWRRWRPFAVSAAGQIFLFSAYSAWWGGMCYGPRLLVEACPFLTLLLLPMVPSIERSAIRRVAFRTLAAWSIFVQILGAALWTGEWYVRPTHVDVDHSRLWDWKDSEIIRTLRSYRFSRTGSKGQLPVCPFL